MWNFVKEIKVLDYLNNIFSLLNFSKLLVEFFDNMQPERLSKQKMKSINDLVHSELFKRTGKFSLKYQWKSCLFHFNTLPFG